MRNCQKSGEGFTLIELMIVIAIVAIVAAIAIPNLVESRKTANEAAAISALKTISSAQVLFQIQDADKDGRGNYAFLPNLVDQDLVDDSFGDTIRQGYRYAVAPGDSFGGVPYELHVWFAHALPELPGRSGDRYFATNQEGIIFYSSQPIVPTDPNQLLLPSGIIAVGK